MSEVRLIVRDAQRDLNGFCHGSFADAVVAALSAEPETIDELDAAVERFHKGGEWSFFRGFRSGLDDESHDAGVVIVDLAARLVAYESSYSSPGRKGEVTYHDGRCATGVWVSYHLSDDWNLSSDVFTWRSLAERRRRERAADPPLDARAVLYGRPVLEFIAAECLNVFLASPTKQPGCSEAAGLLDGAAGPDAYDAAAHDAVRDIHARWLMTPREDLRGRSPRDVLVEKKDFIDRDLQDRCQQWSRQGECPRGLDAESHAFRFAGFGTHELVTYYELLRHLLWSCRDRLSEPLPEALTTGDFLAAEVPRLVRLRDEWLDAPDPEYQGLTPREIIDHERARLPEGMSGHEAVIDDDCPMCQMMADMPGPVFWHLDGCNMDDDFAFSFYRTREEWDEEQRQWAEFDRRFNEKEAERKRLGVEYPGGGYGDPDYVWQRSFVANDAPGIPVELRLYGVGSHLTELIVDLKQPREERPLIDQLSRDFGNLREVCRSEDFSAIEALIEPVLGRFYVTLDEVAATRPDLLEKCSDLQARLRRFLEPPTEPNDEPDDFDDDVPF